MGEIFVKKNNAFERVVSDGNTVIVQGGGGGGSGVTIVFDGHRDASDPCIPYHTTGAGGVSIDGSATQTAAGPIPLIGGSDAPPSDNHMVHFRKLSKHLLTVGVNSNSLNSGQPFDQDGGTFTAPVAGVYKFDANVMLHMSENSASDGLFFYLWIRKNPSSAQITNVNTNRYGRLIEAFKDTEQAGANDRADHMTTVSGTWDVELQAGDKIDLCAAWLITNQTGAEAEYGNCGRLSVNSVSFSGSYVGGASVTPVGPQAFFVKSNGTFTPSQENGSITKISGNALIPATFTEVIDSLNEFDVASGTFTAKTKGVYSVNFTTNVLDGGVSICDVWMQKNSPFNGNIDNNYGGVLQNNTAGSSGTSGSIGTTFNNMSKTWLVEMDVGDNLTWWVKITAFVGSGLPNQKLEEISIAVNLLTSTQTIDPPLETPVGMFAYSSGTLTPTGTVYLRKDRTSPPLNEIFDTMGAFDVDTGVFTAPVTGMYKITSMCETIDNNNASYGYQWIKKTPAGSDPLPNGNGTQDRYGSLLRFSETGSSTNSATGEWLVQLNKDDMITWWFDRGSNTVANISIGACLIAATENNVKMSRGSAPAMVANSPDCGQITLATTAKRIKNSELVTISENPAGMTTPPAENCVVGVFAEDIDTHASFDPVTGVYTAPMKGLYEIQMSFNHFEFASGVYSRYWIEKTAFGVTPPTNGTYTNAINHPIEIASIDAGSLNNSGFIPYSKKWLVELEAGDMITWHAAKDTNVGTIISRNITLSAHLLTSTETVFSDGNPDVLFAFHTKNIAETAGGTSVVLSFAASTNVLLRTGNGLSLAAGSGVEVTDLTSSFDPATGKFTAPVSGWYELDGQVDWFTTGAIPTTTYGRLFVWMEKNNTTNNPLVNAGAASDADAATNLIGRRVEDFSNSTWNTSTNIRNTVYLSQGETVSLCVYGSMTSSSPQITHWSFSGKRIPPVNSSSGIGAGTVYSDYSATENGWTRIAPGVIMQWGREQVPNTNQSNFATGGWDVTASSAKKRIVFGKQFAAIPWSFTVSTGIPTASAFEYDFVAQSQSVGPTGSTILFNPVSSGDNVYNGLLNWIVIGPG